MNIDKTIDKYKAKMDVGASDVLFNKLFPIGIKIVSSMKPGKGTWREVTDATGRALWLSSEKEWAPCEVPIGRYISFLEWKRWGVSSPRRFLRFSSYSL